MNSGQRGKPFCADFCELGNVAKLAVASLFIICISGWGDALAASCVSAPSNIISWWTADGNATDFVGTNHGIFRNGANASNPGIVSNAFTVDGTNGYIQIPDATSLRPTN